MSNDQSALRTAIEAYFDGTDIKRMELDFLVDGLVKKRFKLDHKNRREELSMRLHGAFADVPMSTEDRDRIVNHMLEAENR